MFFTVSNLFGQLIFGSIGFVAFIYGKKQEKIKTMVIGIAMMAYPLFMPATWMLYVVGVALTAALYFFKD